MCDCASWLKHAKTGEILFLRDDEAKTLINPKRDLSDLAGHSAIAEYYHLSDAGPDGFPLRRHYYQCENTARTGGDRIPPVVAKAINRGELKELLTAWYDVNGIPPEERSYRVTTRGTWAKTVAVATKRRELYKKAGITSRTKYIRIVGRHDHLTDSEIINWAESMEILYRRGAVLAVDKVVDDIPSRIVPSDTNSDSSRQGDAGVRTKEEVGAYPQTDWAWGRQCYVPATKAEYDAFWERPKS